MVVELTLSRSFASVQSGVPMQEDRDFANDQLLLDTQGKDDLKVPSKIWGGPMPKIS